MGLLCCRAAGLSSGLSLEAASAQPRPRRAPCSGTGVLVSAILPSSPFSAGAGEEWAVACFSRLPNQAQMGYLKHFRWSFGLVPAANQSLNSGKDKGRAFQASSLWFLTEMWRFSNPSCSVHSLHHAGCGAVCGQRAACTSLVGDVHKCAGLLHVGLRAGTLVLSTPQQSQTTTLCVDSPGPETRSAIGLVRRKREPEIIIKGLVKQRKPAE